MKYVPKIGKLPWRDKRGVTGLETAIVLIAFVVVSAVFAFATLSTGLFSADKSKETIEAGLSEARGTLEVKGAVGVNATIATNTSFNVVGNDTGDLKTAFFPVVVGSDSFKNTADQTTMTIGVNYTINYDTGRITLLGDSGIVLTGDSSYQAYTADSVVFNLANAAGGEAVDLTPGETVITYQDIDTQSTNITNFGVTRLGLADRDNLVEAGETFQITVDTKTFGLTDEDTFTIQVKPAQGAVVLLERTIPTRIEAVMFLE